MRLPIDWSAIEPHDDDFREDYVARVLALAAACERHGIHTLVDLHQDAFSKQIGEDGAPRWAIDPPPAMLLGGPLTDLAARRISLQGDEEQVLAAPRRTYPDGVEIRCDGALVDARVEAGRAFVRCAGRALALRPREGISAGR